MVDQNIKICNICIYNEKIKWLAYNYQKNLVEVSVALLIFIYRTCLLIKEGKIHVEISSRCKYNNINKAKFRRTANYWKKESLALKEEQPMFYRKDVYKNKDKKLLRYQYIVTEKNPRTFAANY